LPGQLLPPGTADSSERVLDPGALSKKKGSGSFGFHLVKRSCFESVLEFCPSVPKRLSRASSDVGEAHVRRSI
jgi:hypothetical protein